MSDLTLETGSPPETGEPDPPDDDGEGDDGAESSAPDTLSDTPEPDVDESHADFDAPPAAPIDAPPTVDMEKAFKQLSREEDRHAKRLGEIMGADFAAMRPCVICDTLGYMSPDVAIIEAYRFSPEAGALAPVSTGERPEALYRENPQTEACATCEGRGLVRTGSRNPQNAVGPCPSCGGLGWVTTTNVAPLPTAATLPLADPSVAALQAQGFTVIPPYVAPAATS